MPALSEGWAELGSFIREQRGHARLSLRRLADAAGVSNVYLSQIERGLRRPSADILQQIARALQISAETLYVRAGMLDESHPSPDVVGALLADPSLSPEHRDAMIRLYLVLRRGRTATTGTRGEGAVAGDARTTGTRSDVAGAGCSGTGGAGAGGSGTDEAGAGGSGTGEHG